MAGKRINLSDLADEPVLPEARIPSFAGPAQRAVRLDQVAPNPLNTRDLSARPDSIVSIAESMRAHGQLQPCTVVATSAFVSIFPEYAAQVGTAAFVQVTGARRRAAAAHAGLSTLDITIKNDLASHRSRFVAATAAENIDREDLDPVEEALAVQLLVQESGSGKAAAQQLSRTPAWVTQRLNLLKLALPIQQLLRSGEMPVRDARTLHQLPAEQQLVELAAWRTRREQSRLTAVNREDDSEQVAPAAGQAVPKQPTATRRLSPVASAIRRLGSTPVEIAQSLRTQLTAEDLQALIKHLAEEL